MAMKLADNPPPRTPGVATIRDLPGRWWVAHTLARAEKAFAWDLQKANIGYFLPLVERITISSGKKRKVLRPLFPSYVFFAGSPEDRHRAMTTSRLCQTIAVTDQNKLIEELASIEQALSSGEALDNYPHAAVGKRCRVRIGSLEGAEGVVVSRDGITRLVLQISMLGQAVSVEIDPELVEPVE